MRPLPMGLLNVDDTLTHIGTLRNINFNSLSSKVHMKRISKSRIYIPLGQLVPLFFYHIDFVG